mgnify:CR=1 FL=1
MKDYSLHDQYIHLIINHNDGKINTETINEIDIHVMSSVLDLFYFEGQWDDMERTIRKVLYFLEMDEVADDLKEVGGFSATFKNDLFDMVYIADNQPRNIQVDISSIYMKYFLIRTINTTTSPRIDIWRRRDINFNITCGRYLKLIEFGLIKEKEEYRDLHITSFYPIEDVSNV